MESETLLVSRKRLTQLFAYLQALDQHRNPPKRQISEQLWAFWLRNLPSHTSINRNGEDFVLRVQRPMLTRCEPPPDGITGWLERGWEDPFKEVKVVPSQNEPGVEGVVRVVRFEDDPRRPSLLADWQKRRDEWAQSERPSRQAMKLFEKLYELHGELEREGERVELVLGDGILNWRRPEGGVHHPVLLKRLDLRFLPRVPEFLLVETEHPVELYSSLFQTMQDVDPKSIARCREELEQGGYHPLGDDSTTGFLRSLVAQLSPKGEFCEDGASQVEADHPCIGRDPVIFLRSRTLGFPMALEAVLEDIRDREQFPTSLLHVAGIENRDVDRSDGDDEARTSSSIHTDDILLSKPANREQEQIVERLQRSGNVVVQGPPGTGKTHTIANLLGHLLAHNKSVLVTSHTAKALRVLRDDHVVPQLQPLCVSVLGNDAKARDQLKTSVEAISHRLACSDAQQLEAEAAKIEAYRKRIAEELDRVRQELLKAREDEYRDIVIAGRAWQPSDAARQVSREREPNAWIPSPVTLGAALPLSDGELIELYRTNGSVTAEGEFELSGELPPPNQVLAPEEFERLVNERNQLSNADINFRSELWQEPQTAVLEQLETIAQDVQASIKLVTDAEPWKLAAIAAGMYSNLDKKPWELLLSKIQAVAQQAATAQVILLQHAPMFSGQMPLEEQATIAEEVLVHVTGGKRLSSWVLLRHPSWRRFLDGARVAARPPQTREHFQALLVATRLKTSRQELLELWDRQMVRLGAPPARQFGQEPEKGFLQFVPIIRNCLDWYVKIWKPLEDRLRKIGFQWDAFLQEQPPSLAPNGNLIRLREAVSISLSPVLAARANFLRLALIGDTLADLRTTLESHGSSHVMTSLKEAVNQGDPVSYRAAFRRLIDLHGRHADLTLRRNLLSRLEQVAPAWASSIRSREGLHGNPIPPGDARAAWIWRQLNDELDRRQKTSLDDIQRKIDSLSEELREITTELIDRRAWAAQVRRTTVSQRQALLGWLDTLEKRGFERGKRAHILQAHAARLMGQCRNAVPVWIMPLSRVVEHFDPRTTRFDVVILDEASQSDVMALLAFYMAKQVVVVGDHEQVSPTSFQDLAVVQHLMDQFLQGIPNAHLYDETTSIYHLARQSFGGSLVLLEHFRCVPEIIQFSNHLSYDGKLKPLRDASGLERKPHVVAHRVRNGQAVNKINREEAIEIAALVAALIEQPEYRKNERGDYVSVGVVSLVGEEQALEIERLLRSVLTAEQYNRHRILCGNSAQFQGDERDVMFLSVVDTAGDGPLALRQDQIFKQRFNVAASRARDQMWVVASLNPSTDLKPGDLRLRLIRHAEDPQALLRQLEQTETRVESELERFVARRLVGKGYRVIPQWKVGYYRIDLVIEGGGKRLAVECDGDRHHPLEKLKEDMEREAVLRRRGWKIARIRGSQFFRNPDQAMRPIFDRLAALDVPPEGPEPPLGGNTPKETELRDRIIRRAEEIRRERWGTDTEQGL